MSRSLYARLARRYDPAQRHFNRREFLRLTLAASAAFLPGCATLPSARDRRIVVLGAGFSGLACAEQLARHGARVTVLEARQRVGGRVHTLDRFIPGRVVEAGAELIGSNHPAWVRYARRFQLSFRDVTSDESLTDPIVLGGRTLSSGDSEALYEEMDAALATLNTLARPVDAAAPWSTPQATQLDATSVAAWLAQQPLKPLTRRALVALFNADYNAPVLRQSLLGLLTQVKGGGLERYWTESEVYRCASGNQALATALARALPEGSLHLGRPVTKVQSTESLARVTCADGQVIEADAVVLAMPPSAWPAIHFEPALPPALAPQLGNAAKYLTAVANPFWKSSGHSPDALTDGPIAETWESTNNQSGAGGTGLTAFTGGPASDELRERWRSGGTAAVEREMELVHPGFTKARRRHLFLDWSADQWTRCGYSVAAPGEITRIGPVWSQPAGRIHFAGEHTCYAFAGYMEGALQSGLFTARRLLA
jgi:monoamine oxidase